MSNTAPEPARPGIATRRSVLVGGAILLAAAIVVGVFVWTADDDADSAEVDVRQACEVVERLPDEVEQDDFGEDSPVAGRIKAATSLVEAAHAVDPDYADLMEAANRVRGGFAGLKFEYLSDALGDLRAECDDLG